MEKTAFDWFMEAARCYLENRQGCVWCGGSHRVYHLEQDTKVQYYCIDCDFRAGYDRTNHLFFHFPGEKPGHPSPKTHYQI